MKQSQKLDALISRIIKEELGKEYNSVNEDSKKKLYPVMQDDEDEENTHYLGNDGKYDYYYSEDSESGSSGKRGTLIAQFDNNIGHNQSGLDGAYGKILNNALKMAHDQKLLTAEDKKTLKQIELERRKQGKIKDGDGIFTLPDDKAELEEETTIYPTTNGKIGGIKNTKDREEAKKDLEMQKAVKLVKPGEVGSLKEKEMQDMEQKPKASEIAGQVAEIMEKLKSMAEGEDPKKGKHAAKVMKYMESAKAALEALTAHETMLEEKDQKAKEDDATKQLKGVRKQLDKILKDKEMADRVMEKLSVEKMIDLKSKAKKDIDEAGLARIMVKHSLKESWVKKKVI